MRALDIIIKKRNKQKLSQAEISFLINEYIDNNIQDYQMAAFLMASYLNGLDTEEMRDLTNIMLNSGVKYQFEGDHYVDKHSTGGVGDKVSLILAPLVASCGLKVPMMSGRGLGHTGGTLDKLDSIKGFKTIMSHDKFRQILEECHYVMTGQTDDFVVADKKLYALRDVTGTVESIQLITASILSKKVAEGANSFVFDVKCGSGAFMKTKEDARNLANSLVSTAKALGKQATALITRMEEPLGAMVGNFLEIKESVEHLMHNSDTDLMKITKAQAVEMLLMGKVAKNETEAKQKIEEALNSGKALDCFYKNIEAQGADIEQFKKDLESRTAPVVYEIKSPKNAYINAINSHEIGLSAIALGAGRNTKEDVLNYDVGFEFMKKTSQQVKEGETLVKVYSATLEDAKNIEKRILDAFEFSNDFSQDMTLVYEKIQ